MLIHTVHVRIKFHKWLLNDNRNLTYWQLASLFFSFEKKKKTNCVVSH